MCIKHNELSELDIIEETLSLVLVGLYIFYQQWHLCLLPKKQVHKSLEDAICLTPIPSGENLLVRAFREYIRSRGERIVFFGTEYEYSSGSEL